MADRRNYYGWARRFERRENQVASMWEIPALFALGAFILEGGLLGLDVPFTSPVTGESSSAISVLSAVAGSMMTVTGIVFSVLTLTVQHAGASVSPRVVRMFYRDRVVKYSLGFFVGTFTYSVLLIADINYDTSGIALTFGMFLVLVSVGVFLYMVNHVGQTLRSASMLTRVSRATHASLEVLFPRPLDSSREDADVSLTPGAFVVRHTGRPGTVTGINLRGLERRARRSQVRATVVARVGDPLAPGDPVMRCSAEPPRSLVRKVANGVAIGEERAIDQDPAFGVRILADTACKALSPGVNDPTTATMALDHLDRILMDAGRRSLRLRVSDWLHGPGLAWDDLVHLALVEVTWYGANAFQVTRRIAALLDHLEELPPRRLPAVHAARADLERRVLDAYTDPADIAFALTPDAQGLSAIRRPDPTPVRTEPEESDEDIDAAP